MVQIRWYYISLIVVLFDQVSKFIAKNHLPYMKNTGVVFGLFKGYNLLFIFLTIIVIVFVIYYLQKKDIKKYETIFLSLILGGAFGNLIDRIIYRAVIDFIDIKIWPAFNVADACVTIGVIGLVIYYLKK